MVCVSVLWLFWLLDIPNFKEWPKMLYFAYCSVISKYGIPGRIKTSKVAKNWDFNFWSEMTMSGRYYLGKKCQKFSQNIFLFAIWTILSRIWVFFENIFLDHSKSRNTESGIFHEPKVHLSSFFSGMKIPWWFLSDYQITFFPKVYSSL